MPHTTRVFLSISLALLGGCAIQPYGLFSNATYPRAYQRPPSASDIPNNATILSSATSGEACTSNVLGLVAWGDSSIRAAIEKALSSARSSAGDPTMLVDVKIDRRIVDYGGVYARYCTQASGVAIK